MERITPRQAGRRLGVSPDTIANWFDAGYLSGAVLPSGRRRIDVAAIDRVAAEGERPRGGSLTPAEWLRREVSNGRLAETPTADILATIADAIRARAATSTPVLAGVDNILVRGGVAGTATPPPTPSGTAADVYDPQSD